MTLLGLLFRKLLPHAVPCEFVVLQKSLPNQVSSPVCYGVRTSLCVEDSLSKMKPLSKEFIRN